MTGIALYARAVHVFDEIIVSTISRMLRAFAIVVIIVLKVR